MSTATRFHGIRVLLAILAAEAAPIVLLILVVMVYGMVQQSDGPAPEEFAPLAGNWVGPIGGFLMTMLMAWWAARGASQRKFAHGAAVGVGTAILDFSLALILGGGVLAPILFVSNAGRLLAGLIGGQLAQRGEP